MIENKKYATFDRRVQLLKVTNFDSPSGCNINSSLSLNDITRIFPGPHFSMYTIAQRPTNRHENLQSNTNEDEDWKLEAESSN